MATLVTDIKQLRKRKQKTEPVEPVVCLVPEPVEPPAATPPTYAPVRESLSETALNRMRDKNPDLDLLVSTFDLEAARVVTPPGYERLWELSGKAISPNQMYDREQVITCIQQTSSISYDRAERGFAMMIESKAIEQTLNPNLYYLGGSTPF